MEKTFPGVKAINSISWGVKENAIEAVIGPNGAGKSTLFNLLVGTLKPSDGNIYFKDSDITDKPTHIRAQMGLVKSYQTANVFDSMTVLENIRIAVQMRYSTYNFISNHQDLTETFESAHEIISKLKLMHHSDTVVNNLSHGQLKKVEVGIALATDPDIILLDEPTTGLEPEKTNEIIEMLISFLDNELKAIVFSEHDIDMVFEYADKITVLNQGRIIAKGPPTKISEDKNVQEVYLEG